MKKTILTSLTALAMTTAFVQAKDIDAAKKIFTEKQDAIVWITGVAKLSLSASGDGEGMPSIPDKEVKVLALGTLVETNGLVICMLSQVDPSSEVNGQSVQTQKGNVKINASCIIKELKVVMPDGTEIPAKLVMKDINLDLGVIKIDTNAKEAAGISYTAVDLKNNVEGQILDEVVTIGRMPEIFNRVPVVNLGHIGMVTKKPRVFLRAAGATGGCPTFNLEGKVIGITAGRSKGGRVMDVAIIPAADVLEVVEQSKNQKPEAQESDAAEEAPKAAEGEKDKKSEK